MNGPNPRPSFPSIDEESILAYVEGLMRPDVELLFASRLDADPGLRAKVEALRRDRDLLMSIPDVEAPPDLVARVEAVLERQALLGAIPGIASAEPERLVLVGDERPMPMVRARTRDWSRGRLAMAAGVALLLMGGVYWSYVAIQRSLPDTSGGTKIALGPEQAAPVTKETGPAIASADPVLVEEPVRIALVPDPDPVPVEAPRLVSGERPAQEEPPVAEKPIRLAELAAQGRLAVHVQGTRATARVAAEVLGYSDSRAWRIKGEAPEDAGRLLAALPPGGESGRSEGPAFASASGIERMLSDPRPIGLPLSPSVSAAVYEPAGPTCYMVECGASDETIEAMRAAITARTGRRAEFAVLDEPRPAPLPLEPEAVLWWTLAPPAWGKRVTIPVLIDSR